jgi:hypothetical protein
LRNQVYLKRFAGIHAGERGVENAIHGFFLVDGLLYLCKKCHRSIDGLGWADDAHADMFLSCRVSLTVGAEGGKSSARVYAMLLVSEQKFGLRQVGTREPIGALRK